MATPPMVKLELAHDCLDSENIDMTSHTDRQYALVPRCQQNYGFGTKENGYAKGNSYCQPKQRQVLCTAYTPPVVYKAPRASVKPF